VESSSQLNETVVQKVEENPNITETELKFKIYYRKLPLKNIGDTLKGPDGMVLVTAHWVLLAVAHDILYF
jgi:hypothetical protein